MLGQGMGKYIRVGYHAGHFGLGTLELRPERRGDRHWKMWGTAITG